MSETPSPRRLEGKRALVTGGGSGIGAAAVLALAEAGARVAVLDIDEDAARATATRASAMGAEAVPLRADVRDEGALAAAFQEVTRLMGGLDILVPNAGVEMWGRDAAVDELPLDIWQETLAVNLTGIYLTCKHGVKELLKSGGGSVVITGSPTGMYGIELGAHAYTASKAGCHGLARVMANEYATRGIRVNAVLPGLIDTPINKPFLESKEDLDRFLLTVPQRRPGRAEEVGRVIAFLASDEASYITGALIPVDGGLTAV